MQSAGQTTRAFFGSAAVLQKIRVAEATWLVAVLSMVLVFTAVSQHRQEVAENALIGLVSGTLVWALLGLAAGMSGCLTFLDPPNRSALARFAFQTASILAHAALLVVALSVFVGKPPLGLLTVVGWGLPIAALVFAGYRVYGPSHMLAQYFAAPTTAVLVALLAFGPINARPVALTSSSVESDEIVLLTWNVGLGQPRSAGSQTGHLDAIAQTIRDAQADIVCLQEIAAPEHLEQLLNRLGSTWHGIVSRNAGRAACVLTRLEGVFDAPAPDFFFGGPASVVLNTGRRELEVFSVHLPAEGAAAWRREHIDWLATHARQAKHPVVIAGDFNMDPEGWWDRMSPLFTDDLSLDRESLERLSQIGRDVGREGTATATLSRRLDRVFVPPTVACSEYRILHGHKLGRMDHQPVVVRLQK